MQDFLWKGGSTIKILRIFYSECQYFSSVNVTSVKICTPTSTFWRHQCDPPLHFNSSIQIYSIASKIRLKKWLEKGGLALSRNRKVMSPIDIGQPVAAIRKGSNQWSLSLHSILTPLRQTFQSIGKNGISCQPFRIPRILLYDLAEDANVPFFFIPAFHQKQDRNVTGEPGLDFRVAEWYRCEL